MARNRLTAIGGGVASFAYDGLGRRTSATLGGVTTGYLHDGADIVQEQTGGTPSASLLTGLGIDQRLSRTTGGTTSTYLMDNLGSTVALVDGAGAIQTGYSYAPYGVTTAAGAANSSRYQFTGRENDGATGLYYYRARYYSPAWGRFISEDPIGLAGGVNLYRYAGGNPLQAVDPSGLAEVVPFHPVAFAGVMAATSAYYIHQGFAQATQLIQEMNNSSAAGDGKAAAPGGSGSNAAAASPPPGDSGAGGGGGNGATRYVSPANGKSVVVDNVTREIIHVGGPGFRY